MKSKPLPELSKMSLGECPAFMEARIIFGKDTVTKTSVLFFVFLGVGLFDVRVFACFPSLDVLHPERPITRHPSADISRPHKQPWPLERDPLCFQMWVTAALHGRPPARKLPYVGTSRISYSRDSSKQLDDKEQMPKLQKNAPERVRGPLYSLKGCWRLVW